MPPSVVTRPSWARDQHDDVEDPDRLPEKVEEVLERRPPRPASRNKLVLDALAADPALVEPALIAFRTGLELAEVERTLRHLEERGRLPRQASLGQPSGGSGTVPPGVLVAGRTPAAWMRYDAEVRERALAPPRRPGASFAAWRAWRESR